MRNTTTNSMVKGLVNWFLPFYLFTFLPLNITAEDNNVIGKSNIKLKSRIMTPEALWAMGRIGAAEASADGKQIVYQVLATTASRPTRVSRRLPLSMLMVLATPH